MAIRELELTERAWKVSCSGEKEAKELALWAALLLPEGEREGAPKLKMLINSKWPLVFLPGGLDAHWVGKEDGPVSNVLLLARAAGRMPGIARQLQAQLEAEKLL